MSVGPRTARILIQAMAKHLPPSGASLRLVDVEGATAEVLSAARADLQITAVHGAPETWNIEAESADAVVAYGRPLDDGLLAAARAALRPGGRLIVLDPDGVPGEAHVETLQQSGYDRILVEIGAECPLPVGVLMRGEKPHTSADTLARIQVGAAQDDDIAAQTDFSGYRGRYVHLLVAQTPNKPAWALAEGEAVQWHAAALDDGGMPVVLAFSSLPKAVAFMQPAVMAGHMRGVNKVAKFSRETAQTWSFRALLNPAVESLDSAALTFVSIDPASAEAPDE